eukprot:20421-Heterococcus_DN1.PRE.1
MQNRPSARSCALHLACASPSCGTSAETARGAQEALAAALGTEELQEAVAELSDDVLTLKWTQTRTGAAHDAVAAATAAH